MRPWRLTGPSTAARAGAAGGGGERENGGGWPRRVLFFPFFVFVFFDVSAGRGEVLVSCDGLEIRILIGLSRFPRFTFLFLFLFLFFFNQNPFLI